MTTMQKVIKYLALAFAIFLCVSIIGGICTGLAGISFLFGEGNVADEMKTYSISGDITSLNVDISAADFAVKTGDKFCVQSNHKYLSVEENGNRLEISEKKNFFTLRSVGVKIELYIPKDTVFESADIETGAGKLTVDELCAEELYLNLGAGEAKIENLNAGLKTEIDGGAGKFTVRNGVLNNLDLDMGVGELNLTGKICGNSSIDHGVGKVNLVLLGKSEDYKIEFDKGVGEASVDGQKMGDGSVFGSGENKIEVDGGLGEIEISFKDNI